MAKGSLYFIILYVVGAVAATLPSLRKHGNNSGYNSVGASGAVSAVMMAFMIMYPTEKVYFFFLIEIPAFLAVFIFFLLEQMMNRSGKTNIAHDAHIWGALFGIVFVAILNINFLFNFVYQVREYFAGWFS